MRNSQCSIIGNSISPVSQPSVPIAETHTEKKVPMEPENVDDKEVVPVPEAHDEVRQPKVGEGRRRLRKRRLTSTIRCTLTIGLGASTAAQGRRDKIGIL